ncbi:hypothetical protein CPC08DRAFT_731563, partial [Agrocybe pediades]
MTRKSFQTPLQVQRAAERGHVTLLIIETRVGLNRMACSRLVSSLPSPPLRPPSSSLVPFSFLIPSTQASFLALPLGIYADCTLAAHALTKIGSGERAKPVPPSSFVFPRHYHLILPENSPGEGAEDKMQLHTHVVMHYLEIICGHADGRLATRTEHFGMHKDMFVNSREAAWFATSYRKVTAELHGSMCAMVYYGSYCLSYGLL